MSKTYTDRTIFVKEIWLKLLLYGSRDFAATINELARHCGHEVVGMVDDYNTGSGILGSLIQVAASHSPQHYGMVLAIGYKNLAARWQAWRRIVEYGYETPKLIHPLAYVADTSFIGVGSMIMAGALVDTRVNIGEATVLWPRACVNHDVCIGDNSFISPNATICGAVTIGSHSFIGAGAVVVDHATVSPRSFVKAAERYTGHNT